MIRFTLDTNCLIDLEQSSEFAASTHALVNAHRAGLAEVAIPAVAASERQADGDYLDHFDRFIERLEQAGLSDLPLIDPIAIYGIGFYGRGYMADQAMVDLEDRIHAILHPEVERDLSNFRLTRGIDPGQTKVPPRWRNALCDVQALWSHIYHKRHCFVTRDKNYFKVTKLPALIALGADRILDPAGAAELLDHAA